MRDVTIRYYIYSTTNVRRTGEESLKERDNDIRNFKALNIIAYDAVTKFMQQDEDTVIVIGDNNVEKIIKDRCAIHNQSSYYVVYHNNDVELVYGDKYSYRKFEGKWTEIESVTDADDYVKLGSKFFMIKNPGGI